MVRMLKLLVKLNRAYKPKGVFKMNKSATKYNKLLEK